MQRSSLKTIGVICPRRQTVIFEVANVTSLGDPNRGGRDLGSTGTPRLASNVLELVAEFFRNQGGILGLLLRPFLFLVGRCEWIGCRSTMGIVHRSRCLDKGGILADVAFIKDSYGKAD